MEKDTDVQKTGAKLTRTALRTRAKADKLKREWQDAEKMVARIEADAAKREELSDEDNAAAMLKSARQSYLRKKRKDFGLPRRVDQTSPLPPKFIAFITIYDAWIKKKRPPKGLPVDWDRLIAKTGRQQRQVSTYVKDLMEQGHLAKISGGLGRAQRLVVVPIGYPLSVDGDENFAYSGE